MEEVNVKLGSTTVATGETLADRFPSTRASRSSSLVASLGQGEGGEMPSEPLVLDCGGWSTLHSIVPTNQSEFLGALLTVKTHLRHYPL